MIPRNAFVFAVNMLLLRTLAFAQAPVDSPLPADAEIHQILADRIGSQDTGIGIVVGVIDAKGRRVVAYGSLAKDDKRTLNGDTVFEIGSMTKVFTSLVLMDMVQKGEVAVTDPVSKYLPASVKVPERNGKKITLQDLSTQSSGLPRMPSNFHPKDASNPYVDYSAEQLYEFLSGYQLTRDIGSQYEYSNLGVGLLGHALTLRAGMDYEAMVRSRICEPLGMNSTRVTLYARNENTIGHWTWPRPGCGAELGSDDAGRRRRTAVQRERHPDVSRGKSRLPQDAARRGHGRGSVHSAAGGISRHADRLRLAHSNQERKFHHLA